MNNFRQITITNGVYKGQPITGVFPTKAKTVTSNSQTGNKYWPVINNEGKTIYIRLMDSTTYTLDETNMHNLDTLPAAQIIPTEPEVVENEDQILDRIKQKFQILDRLVAGVCAGAIKALIVSGPPGVGKTHGIEAQLAKQSRINDYKYEFVKGNISPIGIYKKMYEFSSADSILVFDDCDSVFADPVGLNLFKAALDSSEHRIISWGTESRILKEYDIPNKFEFKGAIIFISNLKFTDVRSPAIREHLMALESRAHYLDLSIDSNRDKFLRIKQVVRDSSMLSSYNFSDEKKQEVMTYIESKMPTLRELSLRTVKKIADLAVFAEDWQSLADVTLTKMSLMSR